MKSSKVQAGLLALLAFFAFANSLGGDFVYDDNRQILMNPLIQQPRMFGKAITSDVWAFKGDGTVSSSNYYRPVFVFWMILNFALFGANPFGWHLFNVLLHVLVCLLSFALFQRLGFRPGISFVLATVFAVHPSHVENVSWISGSPDILLSLFFLLSLHVLIRYGNEVRWPFALSLLLYALALGTKEVAMLLFPLYFLVIRSRGLDESESAEIGIRIAVIRTIPFALLSVVFFLLRSYIIGGVTHPVDDSPNFVQSVLSAPTVLLFYLRQTVFPLFLAENYPLRPVSGVSIGFALSLIASITVIVFAWRVCHEKAVRTFGGLLFLLPLLPALYVGAFPSEQIVHDRYLYLPILGFAIVIGSVVSDALPERITALRIGAVASFFVITLLLSQTVLYNRVWANSFDLWEYNVKSDPVSAASFANYAAELSARGRYADALSAYDRSVSIKRTPLALMGRARNLIALGHFDEAISETSSIIQMPNEDLNAYVLYQAYETAAIAYSSSGRLSDAETVIRNARQRLPIYRAALTDKLAVILYNQGKKNEALIELNSVREQATRELLPASKGVFLRLGMLEAETGDQNNAKKDLKEFLELSATFTDSESLNLKRQAVARLSQIH